MAVANRLIFYFETPAIIDKTMLDTIWNEINIKNEVVNYPEMSRNLFKFNPNTINRTALDTLSIPEEVKRNMLKFRENGGRFYSKADFRKIYGVNDSIYDQLVPFLIVENAQSKSFSKNNISESVSSDMFPFDPNSATDSDFVRLGFTNRQISTIRKYLANGGIFRSKEDFYKIYGISESQKLVLKEFIKIEKKENRLTEKEVEANFSLIELNRTDSVELKKLEGIGDKLSKRIIKYRDLLGGFHSIEQLKEVYGLSEPTFRQIKELIFVDPEKIKKVNLNFADWNELAKHPYIQKDQAMKIVKFRTKYGSIHVPSILLDSLIFNMDEFTRLKPYF